ncbi:MAG: DUF5069 domain-containing protein [Nitrospirae bacterium]|nr:DUF5069 domain-containing protein [Nitrospirota bacterium]
MAMTPCPRSPKIELGGMVHLGRLIDKIRLRHAGLIPDYNYFTTGFDKYLVEFLPSVEEARQWNERILTGGPKDEGTRQRFQSRLAEVAAKRGVPATALPPASTWVDIIELDEGRL